MKKTVKLLLITFVVLSALFVGVIKYVEYSDIQKYNINEKKAEEFKNEIVSENPKLNDELVLDAMLSSYKESAIYEYEKRIQSKMDITTIILISVGISASLCIITGGIIFIIKHKKSKN